MDIWADLTLPQIVLGLLGTLLLLVSFSGLSSRERWHLSHFPHFPHFHLPHLLSSLTKHRLFFHHRL